MTTGDAGVLRILVTGSRDWPDEGLVQHNIAAYAAGRRAITVVHGDCPTGADRHARNWCEMLIDHPAVTEERHPAQWKRPDGSTDRGAGFRRNAEMVELGADVCLAFISDCTSPRCTQPRPHPSHGASHTADLAESAGIKTLRFTP